ncbi:hypothetical protein [Nocardia implantans]|uniref:Uncharacterized protein n=1 Tax=Nocardia implantans TaxID=3108168 RepID=A0ABU6ANU2_9NOCA|nr:MULTISPECIES: hypothetical protein [unclassified Nocardia]MEA3530946.1 hypothetical protein [Nocardia sp. CDC192]MEB3509036.1 hypothetical protein [Nocardia sp. CDC186]
MREPNLDPAVEALVRSVMGAVEELRTARIQLENLDVQALLHEVTEVTEEFMSNLAAAPGASDALLAYAERVRAGECRWSDIEQLARPVPPEVTELKNSPQFEWKWDPEPPPPPTTPPPLRRTSARDNVVGPSDWPDDFDDYPSGKSWLV